MRNGFQPDREKKNLGKKYLRERIKTIRSRWNDWKKIIGTQRTGWKENISTIREENQENETIKIKENSAPTWLKAEKKNEDERGNHCP